MAIRILIYLLALAGMFFINLKIESYPVYVINSIVVLLVLISIIVVIVLRFAVKVELVKDDGIATRGEKYLARVIVHNRSFIPLLRVKLCIKVSFTKTKKTHKISAYGMCGPRSSEEITIPVKCPHCDSFKLEFIKAHVYDYLLLFRLKRKVRLVSHVVIMPPIPEIEVLNGMAFILGEDEDQLYSDVKPGDDPTEIFGIREYVPGDRIRNIHWKLAAKTGKLMVREFGLPLKNNDTIVIDNVPKRGGKRKWIDVCDEYYALLYGLIFSMTKRGYGFNIAYIKGDYRNRRIETQNDIHNLFADIYELDESQGDHSCAKMYFSEYDRVKHRIFYVTQYLDEYVTSNMFLLAETGVVYYLIPGHVLNSKMPVKFIGQRGDYGEKK